MVNACASGVEKHRNRADDLREEDGQDGLPPVQSNADHGAPERPVAERQPPVENHVIPPSPRPLLLRRRIEILVRPRRACLFVAMLIQRRVRDLDPFQKPLPAGECVPGVVFLLAGFRLDPADRPPHFGGGFIALSQDPEIFFLFLSNSSQSLGANRSVLRAKHEARDVNPGLEDSPD